MPAESNSNTTTNIASGGIKARELDFVTRFNKRWDDLTTVMGITRPIRKAPGTTLTSRKATVELAQSVGEGETINLSATSYEIVKYADLTIQKYKTQTTIEAVDKYGAEVAVEMADDAFIDELMSVTMGEFYDFLATGSLTRNVSTFQMAVSMAIGLVKDKFKTMHRSTTNVVVFVNTLDLYEYLGSTPVTVQSKFGLDYIENFLGARTIIISSEIPQGKVYATPEENIVLYYMDPRDSNYMKLDLNYTTAPGDETTPKLVGFHAAGDYDRAVGNAYAIMGMKLWAEYLDGIAIVTIGDEPDTTLSALSIGSLTLTPAFDSDVIAYAANTTNATNTVTATATDTGATVALYLGDTELSGTTATWAEGENTLKAVVTNGTATKTYTVTVTKS